MKRIKQIWACPYSLKEKFSQKEQKGLLLKVVFSKEEAVGYTSLSSFVHNPERLISNSADFFNQKTECFPPQKSDFDNFQKEEFGKNNFCLSLLYTRFYGAWIDSQARCQLKNLFLNKAPIKNHFLVPDVFSLKSFDSIDNSVIKIKIRNFKEARQFKQIVSHSSKIFKYRLDFNHRLSFNEWKRWEKENLSLLPHIDFIEDPFPLFYKEPSLFPLALDQGPNCHCPIRIIKPTRQVLYFPIQQMAQGNLKRVIFTHSLEHPLEARLSWVMAQNFYKILPRKKEVCGMSDLLNFFEKNDFLCFDSHFYSPSGTGLGFNFLLEKQNWKKLPIY